MIELPSIFASSPELPHAGSVEQALGQWVLASDAAIAVFTAEDQLYFATPAFQRLYTVQPGPQNFFSIIQHCFDQQTGPYIAAPLSQWLESVQAKRRTVPVRTFEIVMRNGNWMWGTESTFTNQWTLLQIVDVTSIKNKELALQKARDEALLAAKTDDLTKLLNRGAILEHFHQLHAHCQTEAQPLTLAIIDLDHFKSINDNFGHAVGDNVLCHFANHATDIVCAAGGLIGRTGGEEFLVVLPNTVAHYGKKLFKALRLQLQKHPFSSDKHIIYYTFSSGLVQCCRICSFGEWYRAADTALYTAKIRGRNQDCVAQSSY